MKNSSSGFEQSQDTSDSIYAELKFYRSLPNDLKLAYVCIYNIFDFKLAKHYPYEYADKDFDEYVYGTLTGYENPLPIIIDTEKIEVALQKQHEELDSLGIDQQSLQWLREVAVNFLMVDHKINNTSPAEILEDVAEAIASIGV